MVVVQHCVWECVFSENVVNVTKQKCSMIIVSHIHIITRKIKLHHCIRFVRLYCCLKFVSLTHDEEKNQCRTLTLLNGWRLIRDLIILKWSSFEDFQHIFRVMALEAVLAILVLAVIYFYIFTARHNQKTIMEIFIVGTWVAVQDGRHVLMRI